MTKDRDAAPNDSSKLSHPPVESAVGCGSSMVDGPVVCLNVVRKRKKGSAAARSLTMQECIHCHELFYPDDEDIQVRLGQKDRPVDVTAYSSAATAFEDERDGQEWLSDTGRVN
jgi:hypothetical protein